MHANDFDNRLRDTYEDGRFDYKPEQWALLAQRLPEAAPQKRKKPIIAFWPAAGAIAAGVVALIGIMNLAAPKQEANKTVKIAAVEKQNMAPVASAQKEDPVVIQQTPVRSITPTAKIQSSFPKKTARILASYTAPVENNKAALADAIVATEATKDPITPVDGTAARRKPPTLTNYAFSEDDAPKEFSATSLSAIGGVQFGSVNPGYAVGMNVRRSIGSHAFIEGEVAYLGQGKVSQASTVINATLINQPGMGSGGLTPENASPVYSYQPVLLTSAASLSYLRVAPAAGYKIGKKLGVSAGPDVQRLMGTPGGMQIQMENKEIRDVPNYDWGLAGKAEYGLSKRINTALQYRHGLNNALRNENNFLDRRYLQIQFNLKLLER